MELEEAISKLEYELDKSKIVKKYQGKPKELFDDLDEYIKSIETVLNHLTKQEKMIDIIIKHICDIIDNDDNASLLPFYNSDDNIEEKVRQYFEKKVGESE